MPPQFARSGNALHQAPPQKSGHRPQRAKIADIPAGAAKKKVLAPKVLT
jgi:hypothetical protein